MAAGKAPQGMNTVTPYLTVDDAGRLIDFVKAVFDAEEIEVVRDDGGRVAHAALRIGDTVIETSDARAEWPATRGALHVYVADVDAVYAKAIAAGAESLQPPTDQPYGERGAALRDGNGVSWYPATLS